jgi:hypothetical protein
MSINKLIISFFFLSMANADLTATYQLQTVLVGKWAVQCKNGHIDQVACLTRSHYCNNISCGLSVFVDNKATVICPNGHQNAVTGVVQTKKCEKCGKECRRDLPFAIYDKYDQSIYIQFQGKDCN